jgi:glycosyltransferase involved in cell wall biosynthesis
VKWVFLLGSPDISGGTYVIFEHAIRAMKCGEDIYILTEEEIEEERLAWHHEAKNLFWITYDELENYHFDVAISTWWKTNYSLHLVDAKSYIYFVQSIESKFYPEFEKPLQQLVESTYALNLPTITEATWIKEYLEKEYGNSVYLAFNGARKDLYHADVIPVEKRDEGKLRVLVEGPLAVSFKNVEKTISLCKKSEADEIWLLTSSKVERYNGVDRIFSQVPIEEVGAIYSACDVVVKLSYVEGMFGPPLEMFHCGGTAIVYDVTGHDEYIKHNINAIVVARDDEDMVIKSINKLKNDKVFLNNLKINASQTAKEWISWEESSKIFYEQVYKITQSHIYNKDILRRQTNFYMKNYVVFENYITKDFKLYIQKILFQIKEKIKSRVPSLFAYAKDFQAYLKRK